MFTRADLFVLPGQGGLAIQEAMSYGLPVIVAEADGTEADLDQPGNRRLVATGDVKGLASAIASLLADPTVLGWMERESYWIVSEEINLENIVRSFVEVLRAVAYPA